ncbi:transmembrane protein [Streptococcus pneumoniae]|nr:transmembrane protein [Streptococcus pneumoniae]
MVTKDKGLTYNSTLHAIKVLACFSVVAIHIWLPGKIGAFYQIIARFAVPMFFLISGFYSYNISKNKIQNRIKKIFRLILRSTFFGIGILIAQKQKKIINCKIINKILILGTIIYPILIFLEYYILGNSFEIYISSVLATIILMIFAIKSPKAINIKILNEIGDKYATFVYIIHQFIIVIFKFLVSNVYILKFGTIFVFLICCFLGVLFQFIKNRLLKRFS